VCGHDPCLFIMLHRLFAVVIVFIFVFVVASRCLVCVQILFVNMQ